ncbi:Ribonuclease D [Azospirillaceae bacterium]
MSLISTTAGLERFCRSLAGARFITVDTEFIREKTYWPQLCLVQICGPGATAAIDPLAPGMDLSSLFTVMRDSSILKVFHAARQDVEIFLHLMGDVPLPLFDTQVAAMVCGFGDSVGYETLVGKLAGARLDKSSRFTDWASRPLTDRQLSYALADVTHLRIIYEKLCRQIAQSGRASWLEEELRLLSDPATYIVEPEQAWTRLKARVNRPPFRSILREIAAWRERDAQARDVPRSRIIRDEALLEIAAHAPTTVDGLARIRTVGRGFAEGRQGEELLAAIERGLRASEVQGGVEEPVVGDSPSLGVGSIIDLLRVLLKKKSEDHDVAPRLIASTDDLEAIVLNDEAPVPALSGWRREIFGEDALALKHGRIALTISDRQLKLTSIE